MEEGAIPHILKNVGGIDKRFYSDPLGTFAAHVGRTDNVSNLSWIHRHSHTMAPYSRSYKGALGHSGAGVVRASRTEIRVPSNFKKRHQGPLLLPREHSIRVYESSKLICQRLEQSVSVQGARCGQKALPRFVSFPNDGRSALRSVENVAEGLFDKRT